MKSQKTSSSISLHFRTATDADCPLIAELAAKIWRKHYPSIIGSEQVEYMLRKMYDLQSLKEQIQSGQTFTLVELEEKVIGFYSISSKQTDKYFIHKFYIDLSEQTKGIGTQCFDHIKLQHPAATSFELTVNRQNFTAINFYFKLGFRIQRVADFDIGNGYWMNDFVMEYVVNH